MKHTQMDIVPFKRVGRLVFGTKRDIVRVILGKNFVTIPIEPGEIYTKDVYPEIDVHLEYNEDNELDHIEVGFQNRTLMFQGINLFQKKLDDLIRMFSSFDAGLEIDELGCISYQLGIALYCDNDEGDIDLVSIYSRDYSEAIRNFRLTGRSG